MTQTGSENVYARLFVRVVWLGVAANFALAIPGMIAPDAVLSLLGLPAAARMWTNFASLLLCLLSLFYIAAVRAPVRSQLSTWTVVLARLAGVAFFLGTPFRDPYWVFGVFDLCFFVPELLLLVLALRGDREAAHPPSVARAA